MGKGRREFRKYAAAGVLGQCLLGAIAQATPLNLTLTSAPDIFSGFIDVTYNASSDQFLAQGFSLKYNDGAATNDINNGNFNITATIDGAGNASTGSLLITGTVQNTIYSGVLLTGSVSAFGFRNTGGDPFEFKFNITGGSLAPVFGAQVGLILEAHSTFNGSFASNFNNLLGDTPGTGSGTSDVAPVIPEPSTKFLVVLAGCFLLTGGFARKGENRRPVAGDVAGPWIR